MPAQWTGEIVGKMHLLEISQVQLADALGYTPEYVCAVLNGKRNPKDAEARFPGGCGCFGGAVHDTAEQDQ